jgi:RNA polymerase sigma-70 factor (ECF subfamily)
VVRRTCKWNSDWSRVPPTRSCSPNRRQIMGTQDGLPEMDAYAHACIRCRVRGLAARGIVRRDDFEDICSELYCEFLRRKCRYDPNRSHFKTYTDWVVKNLISTFVTSGFYAGRTSVFSRNRPIVVDCPDESRSDERFSNNIAVQQAVARFPNELRHLAIMLCSESITEISRRTGISRTTLYGRREAIRAEFERHGFS